MWPASSRMRHSCSAMSLARLAANDWDRTVIYHYPDTRERSLHWVAIHTMHEAQHHLLDIRRQV
jgi:hypothetical protein